MKKFKIQLALCLIFSLNLTFAQLNIGGIPYSFKASYSYLLKEKIPIISLEKQDNSLLKLNAELKQKKDEPWQFGKNIQKTIDVKQKSSITELPNGKLYQLSIFSEDALTINLRFSSYKVPENAVLYIYTKDKSDFIGGFSNQNNRGNGIFSTGLLNGDQIILEYFEPYYAEFEGKLIIDRITHGFRGINDYTKSFGSSGDCNMNVECDDGTWDDEVRSVCMLLTGGSAFCTGSLINNTAQDGKPYVLSANHCYRDPSDMIFWFNWESETCENPLISPSRDVLSGAELIARASESDFMLLEMYDEPPFDYNVFYSGWNAEEETASSTVCIHHPSGDIKKISYDDDPPVTDDYSPMAENTHWRVVWDRETTTEPGSSGSPLFDENRQIIGQLHGGFASCQNLDEADWYGKFSYSWENGTRPDSRLKDWLDPLGYEVKSFPGYDPNLPLYDTDAQMLIISSPEDYYFTENSFVPVITVRNRGINELISFTINYSVDDDASMQFDWTGILASGESTEISLPELIVSSGEHIFKAFTSQPNGLADEFMLNDSLSKTFYVYDQIFFDDFENAGTWYLTGEYEIGEPKGLGGSSGNPDPDQAFSQSNVLGLDLTGLGQFPGDYEQSIGLYEEYAQSPAINCINYENVVLSFMRYLGSESNRYDQLIIEAETEDSSMIIWENPQSNLSETEWSKQVYDISKIADGNKIIIRYKTTSTDETNHFCGWNIDDFTVSGIISKEPILENISLLVYPNPARDYFYVELEGDISEEIHVRIFDVFGRIVYSKHFDQNEIQRIDSDKIRNILFIEPAFRTAGVFIISVKTSNSEHIEKILIP
jgi:lysyl endopeptidase